MIPLLAGLFVFLGIIAAAIALMRPFGARAPEARIRALAAAGPAAPVAAALRRRRVPVLSRLLRGGWASENELALQQAGIRLRAGELLLIRVLAALIAFAAPALLWRSPLAPLLALALGALGFLLPAVLVRWARRRRIERIDKQLVDFLPSLASSLRAGFAFQQGVESAAQQLGPPLSDELAVFLNDVNLGASMEVALRELGARAGSRELDLVITAILVQRTTGGSLAEVLDQAAETLRERERIMGDIRALTAQQRFTGAVLSVYPIAIGLLLLAIMPAMWSKLFTEPVGQVQLVIALALQALGFLAIRRALRVDV